MNKTLNDTTNTVIGVSLYETVGRFGSASAEFLKGLRGIDQETGQVFNRNLRDIAKGGIHPDYADNNLAQQAGYAAEVVKTSRDNAEHIINRSAKRVSRTEDVEGYGNNHNRFDHVERIDGKVVAGSHSQMKFVNDPVDLMRKIAEGEGGGKKDLSRYLEADWLDLPSDQVETARAACRQRAAQLREQAERVAAQGDDALAARLRQKADNYAALEGKVRDAGFSRDEARAYRLDPEFETLKDIGRVSHRAGLEGAKFGAAIGGCIGLVTNLVALHSGDKSLSQAAGDVALDTLQGAGLGYATAFAGSALKGFMQQSASAHLRSLSRTSLPSLAVSISLSLGKTVSRYARGDIDEQAMLEEVGATAYGMLSSTVFSAVGQVVIPIPVAGAMIGSMVGYTVSNLFYQSFLDALAQEREAHEHYLFIRDKCAAAREVAQDYRLRMEALISQKRDAFGADCAELSSALASCDDLHADQFAQRIDAFAAQLGVKLHFASRGEFDVFMASDDALVL
ncbi:hypothetical protein [Pseudomonas xantholysinigenes]|uniref:Uncharacterized protein n=1 Tax=Pseudomonas xantholysinigenes TaxID=2745490 RepID=A0A9E6PSZ4_9PSED|nr:hypothetical protein [Pseudomonas xantholysinigenes]QXI36706.1 hypothetical protein HU772_015240 [Pseudomonas xantholysinigenes]